METKSNVSLSSSRVAEVLRRLQDNSQNVDSVRTSFGVLSILSREESNKLVIANEGLRLILRVMDIHQARGDIQEVGCDLIWALVFNSIEIKEMITEAGGVQLLCTSLRRHVSNPDFLKSVCGALSNLCQHKGAQSLASMNGTLSTIISSIQIHQANSHLLPFIFDAIAALIVSNDQNAFSFAQTGIPIVISALDRNLNDGAVAKSGMHLLAIMSDTKTLGAKVAMSGGIRILIPLLNTHRNHPDLARVCAVVILRMLQETSHTSRELIHNDAIKVKKSFFFVVEIIL